MQPRTPITLITGPLGSGKTTLLRHILAVQPEKIAIVMNEFGEIAIDTKVIEGKNVRIAELGGGCVCCSLLGEFEAALFLRKQIGEIGQIESIVIESHDAAVDIIGSEPEKWKPETRETADHSLPYITAIALIDGEVTERQFQPERFTDPKIWKFLENVRVERNAELSRIYAEAVSNIVHVKLKDGRALTKRVDYPLGNAKNPVSDAELVGKFNALVVPELGDQRAKKIVELAWKLDEAKTVDELMSAMIMTNDE